MGARRSCSRNVPIKDAAAIEKMRRAGRIVALALQKVGEAMQPGVTTGELDAVAEQTIRGLGGIPGFLGYDGFPATACISVNEQVVHGIPGPRVLRDGDIVGVDLGAIVDGWNADAAYTFGVGAVSEDAQRLMTVGQDALAAGIQAAKAGNRVADIGAAIEGYVKARGFTVVRDLCGHGIGQQLHEEPRIPNYRDDGRHGQTVLRAGMTLAIEPMVNAGGARVALAPDNWTFVTRDGKLSVHYEHTVVVLDDGAEILTALR